MKTRQFLPLLFVLTLNQIQSHALTPAYFTLHPEGLATGPAVHPKGGDPVDIKIVFAQKKIWLLADEMPMKCLKTVIRDASGKVVLEKCFTSKCSEWFLNIEALPKGSYTLYLGTDRIEKFEKRF